MAVYGFVVMKYKFSLSYHLYAGFYSAKTSYVVLYNFTAGDKVQSQEWDYRSERVWPACVCLPHT